MIDPYLLIQMKAANQLFTFYWLDPIIPKTFNLILFIIIMVALLRRQPCDRHRIAHGSQVLVPEPMLH